MDKHRRKTNVVIVILSVVVILGCAFGVIIARNAVNERNNQKQASVLVQACKDWDGEKLAYAWAVSLEIENDLSYGVTNNLEFAEKSGSLWHQLNTEEGAVDLMGAVVVERLLKSMVLDTATVVETVSPGQPKYNLLLETSEGLLSMNFHGDYGVGYFAIENGMLKIDFAVDTVMLQELIGYMERQGDGSSVLY